ncbi:MAG: DNA alkylation repair protein [archaeon]
MPSADAVKQDLAELADEKKRVVLQGFFKTGPGEYGEGDVFLGVVVPEQRKVAKKHRGLSLEGVEELLASPVHEHRLTAIFILTDIYRRADKFGKRKAVDLYIANTSRVNNWDLVDLSAPQILGDYLLDKDRSILRKSACSDLLWERRISIITTFAFIRNNEFSDTLEIADLLVSDTHDLMHKAVGWMLREVGKRDQKTEEAFLDRHAATMPRTMLRYAIERFDEKRRKYYMDKRKEQ